MRHNNLVTGRECKVPQGVTLMSTTDTQGIITHCNAAFVQISGYSRDELIGQSHSLIRHPDMPAEAFKDLWSTIQGGNTWSSLVKNRCRNGDHYWVHANVTPLFSDRQIIGYLSVRRAPESHLIERAEAVCQEFGQARAQQRRPAFAFRHGQLMKAGLLGRSQRALARVRSICLSALPSLLVALIATSAASLGGWQWGVSISVLVAWLAARIQQLLLERPLRQSIGFASSVAAGDLRGELKINGTGGVRQLQRVLAQLRMNLQTLVGDTRDEVQALWTVIDAVLAGKESLAAATDMQAAGVQQSAASLKQMTDAVSQNVQSAQQGATLAEHTLSVALRSTASVEHMRASMQEICDSSLKISQITQHIDDISFQTNILALNAAVEAARAGEQGRGFAVVASEVRSLANRTTLAAREIKQLSQSAQERVSAGVTEVANAAGAIAETADAARQLRSLVTDVHHSSREQLRAISEISQAVDSLDEQTHRNTVLVQQLSSSADSLSFQAHSLSQSLKTFRS